MEVTDKIIIDLGNNKPEKKSINSNMLHKKNKIKNDNILREIVHLQKTINLQIRKHAFQRCVLNMICNELKKDLRIQPQALLVL